MSRRWVAGGVAATIAAVTVAWFLVTRDGAGEAGASGDATDLATTRVERRDLVERQTLDGSLGFADERALVSWRTGVLTWIAKEGDVLRRGEAMYEVDERPVVLLIGEVPAYRAMSSGVEGGDVRELQRNLLALGFDDGGELEVTGEFDSDTTEAVRDWQEDLGLVRTGVVELGDVAFFPTSRRMGSHTLVVDQPVATAVQIATTTTIQRVVSVDLAASDQGLVAKGDRVRVKLPNGDRVGGRVSSVSRVAQSDPADPTAEPTIEVTIRLTGAVQTELDQAPVDVDVETSRAEDVLAVPVQALLVRAGGGYALEVVSGGATSLVGVEAGDFAGGYVEVSGGGVAEGLEVVMAS